METEDISPNVKFLMENTIKLKNLLDYPQFGLTTWHEPVQECIKKFHEFYIGVGEWRKNNEKTN